MPKDYNIPSFMKKYGATFEVEEKETLLKVVLKAENYRKFVWINKRNSISIHTAQMNLIKVYAADRGIASLG